MKQKREINSLGNKMKHNPNNNVLKEKYFTLCKNFKKKNGETDKIEYKQKKINSLSDNMNKNPKEYWNILKSFKKKVTTKKIYLKY